MRNLTGRLARLGREQACRGFNTADGVHRQAAAATAGQEAAVA